MLFLNSHRFVFCVWDYRPSGLYSVYGLSSLRFVFCEWDYLPSGLHFIFVIISPFCRVQCNFYRQYNDHLLALSRWIGKQSAAIISLLVCSSIYSLTHFFIHLPIHIFTHQPIHSLIHLLTHLSANPPSCPPIGLLIHSFTHSLNQQSTHSSMYRFFHLFTHWSIFDNQAGSHTVTLLLNFTHMLIFPQDLSFVNYSRRMSTLLHLEEIQMQMDIREFDMNRVCLLTFSIFFYAD